jgi:hypothetical protein
MTLLSVGMVTTAERESTCARILSFISNLTSQYANNSNTSSQFFQNAGDVMFLLRHIVLLAESEALSNQARAICGFIHDKLLSARHDESDQSHVTISDMPVGPPSEFLGNCQVIHALCGLGWITVTDLEPLLIQMREYIQANPVEDFTSSHWNPRSASLPAVPGGYCSHCGYIDKSSRFQKHMNSCGESAHVGDELKKKSRNNGSTLSYWALRNLPSPIVPSACAGADANSHIPTTSAVQVKSALSRSQLNPAEKPTKRVRLIEPSVDDVRPCSLCNLKSLNKVDRGNVCDALYWSSVFADLGLESIGARHFTLLHVLKHVACSMRPYKSLEELGEAQFRFQWYRLLK